MITLGCILFCGTLSPVPSATRAYALLAAALAEFLRGRQLGDGRAVCLPCRDRDLRRGGVEAEEVGRAADGVMVGGRQCTQRF